jgi:hypothetical protein
MNHSRILDRRKAANREGIFTVCVLVCLTIAAAVMIFTVRTALRARRDIRLEHQLIQTEWLLDAGVRRAQAAISRQPEYQGETWTPSGSLQRFGDATVQITVLSDLDPTKVLVSASIVDSSLRAQTTRRSHHFTVRLNSTALSTPVTPTTDTSTIE